MGFSKWKDTEAKRFSVEERAAIAEEAQVELMECNLKAIRELAGKTQTEMAVAMKTTQSEVSKVESRSDRKMSTLRNYIEALGGELEVIARVDDKTVRLKGI